MTNDTYRIIVIDDLRVPAIPTDDGIQVEVHRTPFEGLAALKKMHAAGESFEELWLDHDMGFDETGLLDIWPVVDWLEEIHHKGDPLRVNWIFIHTSSPPGRQRMMMALIKKYNVALGELPVEPS